MTHPDHTKVLDRRDPGLAGDPRHAPHDRGRPGAGVD